MGLSVNLPQIICVLADALDCVGVDDAGHSKRVAFMADAVGEALDWPQTTRDTVFEAGLLHDCGVSSDREHRVLVDVMDWDDADAHCRRGADLLSSFAPLAHLAPVVRLHHAHWSALRDGGGVSLDTALLANCIYMVDRVDSLLGRAESSEPLLARDAIWDLLRADRGERFSPDLVDGFIEISDREAFWFTLDPASLAEEMNRRQASARRVMLHGEELRALGTVFARIVDAKSPYTAEHSVGVARVARFIADKIGIAGDRLDQVELAALLHDLGKLRIPDAILEKPAALNREEKAAISRHSFHTHDILRRIDGFGEIAEWAAFHHEELNGEGYPFHKRRGELSIEARVVAVADVYQALVQKRPYRDTLAHESAMDAMRSMAAREKLDSKLVELVAMHDKLCYALANGGEENAAE